MQVELITKEDLKVFRKELLAEISGVATFKARQI